MSAKKTPLQQVNEEHGGKERLVDKLASLVERGEEDLDAVKTRLKSASNNKLLQLLKVTQTVKAKYGTRDKLAEAVAVAVGRAKDLDYVRKLGEFSPAKLLDMAQTLAKRAGNSAKDAAARGADKAKDVAKKTAASAKTTAKSTAKKAKDAVSEVRKSVADKKKK